MENDLKNISFNLWTEPWIMAEKTDGQIEKMSIKSALLQAHTIFRLYDFSAMELLGIQRLLIAIVQDMFAPEMSEDIQALWARGEFPKEAVLAFEQKFQNRFDLFSPDLPFMQSRDLSLIPDDSKKNKKEGEAKSAAYLFGDIPTGNNSTHFRHGFEKNYAFCPACAAAGLTTIPPLTTIGGPGLRASINGTPPLYVLPGGKNLFYALTASLLSEEYLPPIAASRENDLPWWKRDALVEKGKEVLEVGYIQSLTFPARRIRLHPLLEDDICSRCGQPTPLIVRTMVFEMGEGRPKKSEIWLDPFVVYLISQKSKSAFALLPKEGYALWREYAALFLSIGGSDAAWRPRILDQIASSGLGSEMPAYPFTVIGIRTSQAKIIEWIEAGFDVPTPLLNDPSGAVYIRDEVDFAGKCAYAIGKIFDRYFGSKGKKSLNNFSIKNRMMGFFWGELSGAFRTLVLEASNLDRREAAKEAWAEAVFRIGMRAVEDACESVGNDGDTIADLVQAEHESLKTLKGMQKKHIAKG